MYSKYSALNQNSAELSYNEQAFTDSPHTAARAIGRGLSREELQRDIRLEEVRFALATLDPTVILPDVAPSVQKMIAALLAATAPISKSTLAERAGISTQSVRNYLETLEAFSFVSEDPGGYRFALSFHSDDERYSDVLPAIASGPDHQQLRDVVYEVIREIIDDKSRLSDPDDPIGDAFYWPPDLEVIKEHFPNVGGLMDAAAVFVDADCGDKRSETIFFGADIQQQSLGAHSIGSNTNDDHPAIS